LKYYKSHARHIRIRVLFLHIYDHNDCLTISLCDSTIEKKGLRLFKENKTHGPFHCSICRIYLVFRHFRHSHRCCLDLLQSQEKPRIR